MTAGPKRSYDFTAPQRGLRLVNQIKVTQYLFGILSR
jgi:hypothetical protein